MHASENGCLKFCDLNLLQRETEEDNISLLQQSAKRELQRECTVYYALVTRKLNCLSVHVVMPSLAFLHFKVALQETEAACFYWYNLS
jgi:hypothetical protein